MIQVEHLKKTYVGKKHALSRGLVDVSFTLPATGFVFVLGKSGSGKSTLLNLLGALDDKTDGKILIEGKDLDSFNDLNDESVGTKVYAVSQDGDVLAFYDYDPLTAR